MTIFFSDGSSMAEAEVGKILQTIQTTKTYQFSACSASSWRDITGLSVSISNKKNNSGTISFEYQDLDQLDKLIETIKNNY